MTMTTPIPRREEAPIPEPIADMIEKTDAALRASLAERIAAKTAAAPKEHSDEPRP